MGVEQKYFMSYAAYWNTDSNYGIDFFNTIIHIDEEINNDLLQKIESSLLENVLSKSNNGYYVAQIINLNKI